MTYKQLTPWERRQAAAEKVHAYISHALQAMENYREAEAAYQLELEKRHPTPELSWRDVFYSQHAWWYDVAKCQEAAKAASYPYFEWNGSIYETRRPWRATDDVCAVEEVG